MDKCQQEELLQAVIASAISCKEHLTPIMQDGLQLSLRPRQLNSIQLQTTTHYLQSAKEHLILRLCIEKCQVLVAKRKRLRKEVVSKWLQLWKGGKKRKRQVMELLGRATTLGDTGWSREPSDHERAECEAFRRLLAEILDAKVKRTKSETEKVRKRGASRSSRDQQ
jgi:hypothetical protein